MFRSPGVFDPFCEVVPEVEGLQLGVELQLLREERLAPEVALGTGQWPREDKGVVPGRMIGPSPVEATPGSRPSRSA